uniref:Uncharacterized protein n=1 Tax=Rhizophora mucronata TaxID=61149 RepID=A0A2P2MQG9_RHIMU
MQFITACIYKILTISF